MTPRFCLDNSASTIVLDTSVLINLLASGAAEVILGSLTCDFVIPSAVAEELNRGRSRNRLDADGMESLLLSRALAQVELGTVGLSTFEMLVVGAKGAQLDDGESATIAVANEIGGIAALDELRATRVCAEHFCNIRVVSSVDIFAQRAVRRVLGDSGLRQAVYSALSTANMSVHDKQFDWVVHLIGEERANECTTLKKQLRVMRRNQAK